MKTVLIFAHECAPYHRKGSTIGSQRPSQFAKHLHKFGWKTIVLCCDNSKRRTIPKQQLNEFLKTIEIQTITNNTNSIILPLPSLKHASFLDKIWYKLVAVDEYGSFYNKGNLKSYFRKIVSLFKLTKGDYSEAWQPVALGVAEKIISAINIDICIAEHTPDASLFIANHIKNKHNIPWIADFRDPVLQPYQGINKTIIKAIAKKLLKNASATINVTPYWSELDHKLFSLPSYCIPNGFDEEEFNAEEKYVITHNFFTISYFGSIKNYQNSDIFFEGFSAFIQKISPEQLSNVKFIYRGTSISLVHTKATQYGIEKCCDIQKEIARADVIKLMMSSDFLLLLPSALKEDIHFKNGFYPGKVFEYFAARKPIIVIPGDNGMLDSLILKTNTGVILNTTEEVATYLYSQYKICGNREKISFSPNYDEINKYKRENQAKQLATILDKYSEIK